QEKEATQSPASPVAPEASTVSTVPASSPAEPGKTADAAQGEELYGVPSPCIISSTRDAVYWQPQPFEGEENVNAVERAFDIM
ncbi:SecY-interacting protein Syd, partial [Salmonella enterica subsp. enterica serovar Lubbock]|nr:SecY-interacting protein Syd [Salmonella enterica subsp. enterica serovar Lubbock]